MLTQIPIRGKGLVISDCEGYEKELFVKETARQMSHCDFLIEVHDHVDITISSALREVFGKTHDIEVVESVDDIKKAKTYEYAELAGEDLRTRKRLLAEHRRSTMEWFLITPKSGSPL